MARVEKRISQAGFARLRETLLQCEIAGYGPAACAAMALNSVGLSANLGDETVLVVDYNLDGPVYPFMDRSAELVATRRA